MSRAVERGWGIKVVDFRQAGLEVPEGPEKVCAACLRMASQGRRLLVQFLFRFLSQPSQVFSGSCDREGLEEGPSWLSEV